MKHLILTGLMLLSLPITSFAGHSVNNGVDLSLRTDHALWFAYAKRPIKACLEVADDFGVDAATAETKITQAFVIWDRYFDAKRVRQEMKPQGLGFSMNLQLARGCRGDEDLSFYLGVNTPQVEKASDEFTNPLGFARRTAYDEKALWGKGLIWVAPPAAFAKDKLDWSQDDRLLGILLHEIGHAYGCGHVAGTIMRENLSDDLLDARIGKFRTFGQVDSGRQLILCPQCPVAYEARIMVEAPIEKLIGKKLSVDAHATMAMEAGLGSIKIIDGKNTYAIFAAQGNALASESSDVRLLSIPASGDFDGYSTSTTGFFALLTLSYNGRQSLIGYRRNMQYTVNPRQGFVDELLTLDPEARNNLFLRLDPTL
ncbi:MAG: hypothetical protein EOP11_16110 [Proteobacteria bacterium]|nr:MAG: hypothetical protein EOP11_16110 [Pseudomonadota bacterium]